MRVVWWVIRLFVFLMPSKRCSQLRTWCRRNDRVLLFLPQARGYCYPRPFVCFLLLTQEVKLTILPSFFPNTLDE